MSISPQQFAVLQYILGLTSFFAKAAAYNKQKKAETEVIPLTVSPYMKNILIDIPKIKIGIHSLETQGIRKSSDAFHSIECILSGLIVEIKSEL